MSGIGSIAGGYASQGWQCPVCKCVWGPSVQGCQRCNSFGAGGYGISYAVGEGGTGGAIDANGNVYPQPLAAIGIDSDGKVGKAETTVTLESGPSIDLTKSMDIYNLSVIGGGKDVPDPEDVSRSACEFRFFKYLNPDQRYEYFQKYNQHIKIPSVTHATEMAMLKKIINAQGIDKVLKEINLIIGLGKIQ